jgi:hypothetical protein
MSYLILIGMLVGLFGVIYFLLGIISGNDDESRMAIAFGITAFITFVYWNMAVGM